MVYSTSLSLDGALHLEHHLQYSQHSMQDVVLSKINLKLTRSTRVYHVSLYSKVYYLLGRGFSSPMLHLATSSAKEVKSHLSQVSLSQMQILATGTPDCWVKIPSNKPFSKWGGSSNAYQTQTKWTHQGSIKFVPIFHPNVLIVLMAESQTASPSGWNLTWPAVTSARAVQQDL